MSSKKYRKLNIIVVRKCMEFYIKCYKHRNDAYHNADRQKERIKNYVIKERENSMNSNIHQVRDYVRKFAINEEKSNVEKFKKWIMNLKKLKKDSKRYLEMTLEDTWLCEKSWKYKNGKIKREEYCINIFEIGS